MDVKPGSEEPQEWRCSTYKKLTLFVRVHTDVRVQALDGPPAGGDDGWPGGDERLEPGGGEEMRSEGVGEGREAAWDHKGLNQ